VGRERRARAWFQVGVCSRRYGYGLSGTEALVVWHALRRKLGPRLLAREMGRHYGTTWDALDRAAQKLGLARWDLDAATTLLRDDVQAARWLAAWERDGEGR
jgi:hypothetical protein